MTSDHIIENITAQMIRDTAGWSQSEHDLRDTLRLAAEAIEAAEAERDALRKALEPFSNMAAAYRQEDDPVPVIAVIVHGERLNVTVGDLRRARTLAGDNHE
jgi:plasmid stabilization system protein ParE